MIQFESRIVAFYLSTSVSPLEFN
uniref:Uncharacterized protein n=1 Tax=Tetranychus urticae TaxID=32264 RepID=T1JW41_TETUR